MTCRHLLPRFDLSFGQTLHSLGRLVVAHPLSSAAVILLPLCAAIFLMICRDPRSLMVARWRGLQPGAGHGRSNLIDDRFGPAHSS